MFTEVARPAEGGLTMPKYKSTDGQVFDSMMDAMYERECKKTLCWQCKLYHSTNLHGYGCIPLLCEFPQRAARMMGYEIIEDNCDQTATDSNQEAKSDGGKPRPSHVPPALIRGTDAVREYGTKTYGSPDNRRKVEPQRYWDALLRHVLAAWDNWKAVDPESGMPHLWHIACNASFLMQYMEDENERRV